ncbi:MAG TPA: ABC transporter substrate-binding protein [Phototrophicaceae bacterium]|nr:ABC transporter substrate-binding protein [Phototrophicaceae bacterium]
MSPKRIRLTGFFLMLLALLAISWQTLAQAATPAATDQSAANCTPSGDTVTRGGELRLARPEEPLTFDPTVPGDNGSIYAITQVFDTLTRVDASGTGLEPDLASSWDISSDQLTYTFHLRDAKFSNGEPVTADDVVFSWGRAQKGSYAFIFEPVDTITKTDDHTVVIKLKRPYTPFLSVAALFQAAIVPQDVYTAEGDDFGTKPVGSGPFMVQEYTKGDKVVLVPNPYYWELGADCKPLPYLDKVTMSFVSDSNSRVLGFQNGDFDVMASVPANQAASVQAMSNVTLEVAPIYRLDYVYVNHQDPVLSNKDFDLALNYAVDRSQILKLIFFGYGEIPNSFMPKENFWSKDVQPIPYDPDKAKQLIASSGYSGQTLTELIPAGDAPTKQLATILQQFWGQVGINVQLQEADPSSTFDTLTKGNYQLSPGYITSDINDVDELASLEADYHTSGFFSFFSWYKNDDVSNWLAQARQTNDDATRADLYAKVQQQVYWDGYSIPLNFTPVLNSYYNYVHNWKTVATGWWWLRNVWMDAH